VVVVCCWAASGLLQLLLLLLLLVMVEMVPPYQLAWTRWQMPCTVCYGQVGACHMSGYCQDSVIAGKGTGHASGSGAHVVPCG